MGNHLLVIVLLSVLLTGCRTTNGDRLPATAADNPDPIFGGTAKLRQSQEKEPPAVASTTSTPPPGMPTSQRSAGDRIGPLGFQPKSTPVANTAPPPGITPGTANLATGVKPPEPESVRDQQVQPVSNNVPASSPEVVNDYRNRMNRFGVVGLRTKALPNGTWEAVGHFPVPSKPDQLRRIETQGVTEADALLAILELLEKQQ